MKEFRGSQNYVADEELLRAVNIAMVLQKPLLIKGEPGTGKTMLAQAISQALDKELVIWNIKSTTKAQDGLYVYDVVQRLYDSQFGGQGVDDIAKYVKLGKLGEAFTADKQVILLIDEIDKADLEFPNDLLWELDRMEVYIPETGETVKAKHRPVVIITSNAEKELPDAFLRRCVFHYIAFPDKELMADIVRVHYPDPVSYTHLDVYKRQPQKQSGALHQVLCPAFFQESGGVEKSVENVHLSHFIPFSLTKNMLYCSLRFTCILHFLWEGSSWPISIVSSASPKGATPDTWFGTICGSLWGSPPWACCWAG